MIIAISGRAGSGKSEFAAHLVSEYGFHQVRIGAPLYRILDAVDPFVDDGGSRWSDVVAYHGTDEAKRRSPEIRRLLQHLGLELRTEFDRDILLRPAIREAHRHMRSVVSDVRYLREVVALQRNGAVLIRITRPGLAPDTHQSETELSDEDNFWDFVVENDGDLAGLHACADKIMGVLSLGRKEQA